MKGGKETKPEAWARCLGFAGLSLSVAAGLAPSVFPQYPLLPGMMALLAGVFVGCPLWRSFSMG